MNFDKIKDKIHRTIDERDTLAEKNPELLPSKYWQDFCERTRYVFDLSDKELKNIRYHTYHLTSDLYLPYYFGDAQAFSDGNRIDWRTWGFYSEPLAGIGFECKNRYTGSELLISSDLVRYKHIIDRVGKYIDGSVLEIGAGYGGLAYQIISHYRGVKQYIIVDIPEVLIFPAVYLTLNCPDKKIYVYNPQDYPSLPIEGYDIAIIPNYRADLLLNMKKIKLAINTASFQEMTSRQVYIYLNILKSAMKEDGVLYSWNMDKNPANQEDLNITNLLKKYFQIEELVSPAINKTTRIRTIELMTYLASKVGLTQQTNKVPAQIYKEYICKKKKV